MLWLLLLAEPAITVGVIEVAELSSESAAELATDLTSEIARASGREARFDPALQCPAIDSCRAGDELVLLRIFAGAKHVRVIALRGKSGALVAEESVDLPEDLLRRGEELERLARRLYPPLIKPSTLIPPGSEKRSPAPFWIAGAGAALGIAALAVAIAAPSRPEGFEQRGVLSGDQYDALAPSSSLQIASLSLAAGAVVGLALAVWMASD